MLRAHRIHAPYYNHEAGRSMYCLRHATMAGINVCGRILDVRIGACKRTVKERQFINPVFDYWTLFRR